MRTSARTMMSAAPGHAFCTSWLDGSFITLAVRDKGNVRKAEYQKSLYAAGSYWCRWHCARPLAKLRARLRYNPATFGPVLLGRLQALYSSDQLRDRKSTRLNSSH